MAGTRGVTTALALLALAGSLTACAGSGGGMQVNPESDSSVTATIDRCEGLTSSGAPLVVEEGDSVVVDADLGEGEVRLRMSGGGEDSPDDPSDAVAVASGEESAAVSVDETLSGRSEKTYPLAPGDYSVTFIVPEGTTANGTVSVISIDEAEQAARSGK